MNLSSDEKLNTRPAPPRLARAEREGQKRGKVDTAAASSGQETVSETFLRVFLEQFLTRIPNMLLVSYDYRYISSYQGWFLITVWSLARCP